MPIYEYKCTNCGQKARKFWRTFSMVDDASLQCPRCGEHRFQRLVSRVAVLRSEDAQLNDLSDPSNLAGLDEDDPRSLGRWLRKMSQEMGEDMPPEFDEVIDRLEIQEVLGTIGGEDTLLVVFREDADKTSFVKRLTGEDTLPSH